VLAAGSDLVVTNLTGDRSDLNFQVSPLSGMSPARAGSTAGPSPGWRRSPANIVGGGLAARP
jgi:hypothetical protein